MLDLISKNARILDKFLKHYFNKQKHSQLITSMKYGVLFGGKKKVLLLLLLSVFFPKQESLVETSRCLPVWESSLWKTGLSGNGICHRAAMWVAWVWLRPPLCLLA